MKNRIIQITVLIISGVLAVLNILLFGGKHYSAATLLAAFLACLPFYFSFECQNYGKSKEIMMISIMTALSVCGRIVFGFIPFFKPVTAITIISGMYLGYSAGFVTGSFSALISNIYFGHGPWTIFQMCSWGLIGCLAGVMGKKLENKIYIIFFSIFSGTIFSVIMDLWTVLNIEGKFSLSRYMAVFMSGIPVTVTYSVSNIIFLMLMQKPFGRKLERAKLKYGIFKSK